MTPSPVRLLSPLLVAVVSLSLPVLAAGGPLVSEVFLFSDYSYTDSTAAGVSLIGTAGVRLGMDPGLAKATSLNPLGGSQTFKFDGPPTYAGHTDGINKLGETVGLDKNEELGPGGLAARITAEVTKIDDLGLNDGKRDEGSGLTSDRDRNVDFKHKDATLTLAVPTGGGWNKLVLVEDAGLDAMRLELCSDASCSNPTLLFDGFGTSWNEAKTMRDKLKTETPGFSGKDTDDPTNQDQAWVFLLTDPLQGYLRISRAGNWGGSPLELDFVGFGRDPTPQQVPQPGTFLLAVSGLLSLGALVRRGRRPHLA